MKKNKIVEKIAETSKFGIAGVFAGIFCLVFAVIYSIVYYSKKRV